MQPQIAETTVTHSSEETIDVGARLGSELRPGDLVLLGGPLGAGKSTLAAGIGRALGARRWRGSPTFTLVNEYETVPELVHLDLYRLASEDLADLGLEEYVDRGSVLIVEWPERAASYLESLDYTRLFAVEIVSVGEDIREIRIRRASPAEPATGVAQR